MENRHKATLCGIGFMSAFFANKRAQNYAENLDMCDFCINTHTHTHTDSSIPYYNIIIARATRAIMTGRSLQANEGGVFSPLRGFAVFFAL